MIFREHKTIIRGADLSEGDFDDLKKFASYEENHRYIDIVRGGKGLKLKSYVGTIMTNNGLMIEILPKVHGSEGDDTEARKVLLKMLRTLRDFPSVKISDAFLDTTRMNIFEIFITMFLEELSDVLKKGLRSSYLLEEDNLYFLRGKIKPSVNLRQNLMHKERFFVEFDSYSLNRPENRLIKTLLHKLYRLSKSFSNKRKLMSYMFTFDEVEFSEDIENDFRNCSPDRTMSYYEKTMNWCRIFLRNKSISPHRGREEVYSLLFDMNLLFESYVGYYFRRNWGSGRVRVQDKRHHLIESPKRSFRLRPDIVVNDNIVLDTKWKLINGNRLIGNEGKQGLSQSDLYQMYAYGKKYGSADVYLIYPKSDNFKSSKFEFLRYDEELKLYILCFDCLGNSLDVVSDSELFGHALL